jgi:hypothetical protein
MPGIYHQAARVIAWLGDETEETHRVLVFMKCFAILGSSIRNNKVPENVANATHIRSLILKI